LLISIVYISKYTNSTVFVIITKMSFAIEKK